MLDNENSKWGTTLHSMTLKSRDVFDNSNFEIKLTYTSERYLVFNFFSASSKYRHLPTKKIIRFRKHPKVRRIFEKLSSYFPEVGILENGSRIEITGDTLLTDECLEFITVDVDSEIFEDLKSSIPIKNRKLLNSKNTDFKREWQLDYPFVLIVNGRELFCVCGVSDWEFLNSQELTEYFSQKPTFEYSNLFQGYPQKILFCKKSDFESAAYFQGTFGREYFISTGPLVLTFYRIFNRLFSLGYSHFEFRELVTTAIRAAGPDWTLQSGALKISMNVTKREQAILGQIIDLRRWNWEFIQRGVTRIVIRDDFGKYVASLRPLVLDSDGSWSHGGWKVKEGLEEGGYSTFESPSALEGILYVTSGNNFTLKTIDAYDDSNPKRVSTFYGLPYEIYLDNGEPSYVFSSHFNVKFYYAKPSE